MRVEQLTQAQLEGIAQEYNLILRKQSKLSRKNRETISAVAQAAIKKGLIVEKKNVQQ